MNPKGIENEQIGSSSTGYISGDDALGDNNIDPELLGGLYQNHYSRLISSTIRENEWFIYGGVGQGKVTRPI